MLVVSQKSKAKKAIIHVKFVFSFLIVHFEFGAEIVRGYKNMLPPFQNTWRDFV